MNQNVVIMVLAAIMFCSNNEAKLQKVGIDNLIRFLYLEIPNWENGKDVFQKIRAEFLS